MHISKVAHLLLIAGVAVYLLSSLLPWHTLSFTGYDDSLQTSESLSPFGTWFSFSNNSSHISFLIIGSSFSSNNTTYIGNMPPVNNRIMIFNFIWYFYLINFGLLVVLGIVMAFNGKKVGYILSFLIAMIIVGSILIFLLMYQDALTSDMRIAGISDIDMYGGKVFIMNGVISSGLDWGFGFAMISAFLLLLASFIYVSAPEQHKHETKKEVNKKAPAPAHEKEGKEEKQEIKRVSIKCPNCGNEFKVDVDMSKLPVTVQCPYCGTKGKIG